MTAATGASTAPMPSAIGSRTGRIARTVSKTAPMIAIGVMTARPSTQGAVAVDLATEMVIRSTKTADQNRPPPIHSRARSSASEDRVTPPSNAASGPASRPLGDTYRIPGPHQSREVVAATHHVKVDVLAEVEADVLVRAAEARGVEVEDDKRRPPSAHRLEEAHPTRIGARSDDGDRAARKAANPIPRERLGERRASIRRAHRQVVEDEAVLAHCAVRLEHSAARVVGDQADLASAAVHLRGHRCSEADRVLDGRLLVLAEMHGAVQVEEDPEVGRQRLLESL